MALRIEDYALIGNTRTAALVGRDGSIDWLCLPRFDSGACFAALLGNRDNGRWLIRPKGAVGRVERRYRDGTLILETLFETQDGAARLIDFMPLAEQADQHDLVRIVEGVSGAVEMEMEVLFRFDYGSARPWLRRPTADWHLSAIAGPDAVHISTPVTCTEHDNASFATFTVRANDRVPFILNWHPSHHWPPAPTDPFASLDAMEAWWRAWSDRCPVSGPWKDEVRASLLVLKGLTYSPTGGIIAAPTTSLPERIGGERNWDYRFCWVRDASVTLYCLIRSGYTDEAQAWRDWLLRAVAGHPADLNIMYGIGGERRLPEMQLEWLSGYENSRPVRIGNSAHTQRQLDVYGEVMATLHAAREHNMPPSEDAWLLQKMLLETLESQWAAPDEGVWEVRGPRRHFTHSKVMAWVAVDRMIQGAERFGHAGPVDHWRALRHKIRRDIETRGFDGGLNTFVQHYGGRTTDAALLAIPLVGFLPASDPRVAGTVTAIERELMSGGLLMRYVSDPSLDGLSPGEGAFLACNFWYVDNLILLGRHREALAMYQRLLGLRNDVGLLAEEYDPASGRMLGNFPQAFSHVAIVNTAHNLTRHGLQPRAAGQHPEATAP